MGKHTYCPECGSVLKENPKKTKDWLYCSCGYARPTLKYWDRQPIEVERPINKKRKWT